MAGYEANIILKVDKTAFQAIDTQVAKLEERLGNLGSKINLSKGITDAVNALSKAEGILKTNLELIKQVEKVSGGGSQRKAVRNGELLKEQTEQLRRQLKSIREQSRGLFDNAEITRKLLQASSAINQQSAEGFTLARAKIRSAKEILKLKEAEWDVSKEITETLTEQQKIYKQISRDSDKRINDEVKNIQRLKKAEEDRLRTAERLNKERYQAGRQALGNTANKVDGAFGNAFSGGVKALESSAIRASAAGAAVLAAKALDANVATKGLVNAIQALAERLPVLGNAFKVIDPVFDQAVQLASGLTDNWAMLAVAAAALLPVLPAIGQGAVKSVRGVTQLGKALADLTGISEAVKKTNSTFQNEGIFGSLSSQLFELGNTSQVIQSFDALETKLNSLSITASKIKLGLNGRLVKLLGAQVQKLVDKSRNWNQELEKGRKILKEYRLDGMSQELNQATREARELNRVLEEGARKRAEARASYFGTSSPSRQQAIDDTRRLTGDRTANVPALRPANYTDQDVRVLNTKFMKSAAYMREMNGLADKLEANWIDITAEAKAYNLELTKSKINLDKQIKARQKEFGLLEKIARKVRLMELQRNGRKESGLSKAAGKAGTPGFGENLALGVGFPLLFGGGPGSVIGSGIGSFFGQGFGGQILGGALGQILDQAVAQAAALGNAINGSASNMDKLREAGLGVTAELEEQLKLANAAGDVLKARQTLRDAGLQETGDFGGIQSQAAAASVNELQKAWNGIVKSLQVAVGGLLSGFVFLLAAALRIVQGIVQAWNVLVSGIINGLSIIPGVRDLLDQAYQLSIEGSEEYERQNAELLESIRNMEAQIAAKESYNKTLAEASKLGRAEYSAAKKMLDIAQKQREAIEAVRKYREEKGVGATDKQQLLIEQDVARFRRRQELDIQQLVIEKNAELQRQREQALKDYGRQRKQMELEYSRMQQQLARANADERIKAERAIEDAKIKGQEAALRLVEAELRYTQQLRQTRQQMADSTARLNAASSGNFSFGNLRAEVDSAIASWRNGMKKAQEDRQLSELKIEQQLAKSMLAIERYKEDNARRIARLNEDSAQKVADLNTKIAQMNEKVSKDDFERKVKAQAIAITGQFDNTIQEMKNNLNIINDPNSSDTEREKYRQRNQDLNTYLKWLAKQKAELRDIAAEAARADAALEKMTDFPKLGGVTDLSGPVSDAQKNAEMTVASVSRLIAELGQLGQIDQVTTSMLTKQLDLAKGYAGAVGQITEDTQKRLATEKQVSRLIREGVRPELAAQLVQIDQITANSLSGIALIQGKLLEVRQSLNPEQDAELISRLDAALATLNGSFNQTANAGEQLRKSLVNADDMARVNAYIDQITASLGDAEGQLLATANILETGIGNTLNNLFGELTAGTMNFQEAAAKSFKAIGDDFIRMGTRMIAQYVVMKALGIFAGGGVSFGAGGGVVNGLGTLGPNFGIPQRASGGPVNAGQPYVVGEQGRELFVPNSQGRIVANDQLGGGAVNSVVNVTVNSDGSTSRDEDDMSQLGKLVEASVVGVITRERRPGGLLSR